MAYSVMFSEQRCVTNILRASNGKALRHKTMSEAKERAWALLSDLKPGRFVEVWDTGKTDMFGDVVVPPTMLLRLTKGGRKVDGSGHYVHRYKPGSYDYRAGQVERAE